ncbi:MAG: outer membrane lipid asymmetry maintenance protein MlaD [Thiogranum sp.]|nr:outer membrane lipid asymmetry maintenance protein MlaD [Thiogranum sp.]
MNRWSIETGVGLFVVAGLAGLFFLATRMGEVGAFEPETWSVEARFTSVSGLKEGSLVELAGVRVGKVRSITLDPDTYEAVVHMNLDRRVALQEDSVASIRTAGIIGDRYVKLSPGGSALTLETGDEIIETESSISIEELVSKYIFEGG